MVPLVAPVESNGSHRHLRVTPLIPPLAHDAVTRGAQRQLLRSRRAALSAVARDRAARAIADHIRHSHWLHRERPIALYVPVGSEVPIAPLHAVALRRGVPVYLPRIVDYRAHHMVFARAFDAPTQINRYGIPEPPLDEIRTARMLSVVFMPLLGFDTRGTRLGYGAGYYDRAFSYRRHRVSWHRPLLIGVAYACQELEHIDAHAHDIPLDAVVTEFGVRTFQRAP